MSDKPIALSRFGQIGLNKPKERDGSKRKVNDNQPKKITKVRIMFSKLFSTNSKTKKGTTHKNHWGWKWVTEKISNKIARK